MHLSVERPIVHEVKLSLHVKIGHPRLRTALDRNLRCLESVGHIAELHCTESLHALTRQNDNLRPLFLQMKALSLNTLRTGGLLLVLLCSALVTVDSQTSTLAGDTQLLCYKLPGMVLIGLRPIPANTTVSSDPHAAHQHGSPPHCVVPSSPYSC